MFLGFGIWLSFAGAADFCVTNSAELQAALDIAETNGQDDTVRIVQGTYAAPPGGFTFSAPASEDGFSLTVSGGFTSSGPPFFICSEPVLKDPELTVLDGGGTRRVMILVLPQEGSVDVRNLSFINGFSADSGGSGGLDLFLPIGSSFAGTLTVENNIFLLNKANQVGGLNVGGFSGLETVNVRVVNNLFVGNQANQMQQGPAPGAAYIAVSLPEPRGEIVIDPRPAVSFVHNTVVDNHSINQTGGVFIAGDVTNLYVASNNFWNNSGNDLEWFGVGPNRVLRNNNIQQSEFNSLPPTSEGGNISAPPQFLNCGPLCVDRIPAPGSPLIDAGYSPLGPPFQPWSAPSRDLNGEPRVQGSAIDIGAYEGVGDRVFNDRFASD
ncbi:MAG: choice-of-anchor Q domain-containing protein [Wenzhouxiangella sp.]|jgi:hypothetical protein|nr:choice-of-anchor Q domain-containing protein [Wenzhouxiangella sp.]